MKRVFFLLFGLQLALLAACSHYFYQVEFSAEISRSKAVTFFFAFVALAWMVEYLRRRNFADHRIVYALANCAAVVLGVSVAEWLG